VEDYFKKVKNFLDRHPNEVLTLILANPEKVSVANVWQPIFESSGEFQTFSKLKKKKKKRFF